MMSPVIDVIVKLTYIIDLIFRLHRAVLGQAHVDPGATTLIFGKIYSGISQGLSGAVHSDTTGSGSSFVFLFFAL